jgi:hypothetical protein
MLPGDPRMDHGYRQQTPGYSEYATGAIRGLFPTGADMLSASGIPGVSDAADVALLIDSLRKGNFGEAGILGAAAALPFVGAATAKQVFKAAPKVFRYETKSGRGLMNNEALDRMRLTDDEEDELIELMDFGLEQPRNVPGGALFAFTEEGEKKHERLLQLLKKAAKEEVVRREFPLKDLVWESSDGQVAFLP